MIDLEDFEYVHEVPDDCDRILWKGRYYHLSSLQSTVSAEDRAEQFIQAAIDSAPEPLRRLGDYLASVLDSDHFETANRLLLALATKSD